jgi:uncharacterized surface protein with fasciclin (FAS1) repeats
MLWLFSFLVTVTVAIPRLKISETIPQTTYDGTLGDYLQENNQTFGILNHLLNVTGLTPLLNNTGEGMNATVFAPDDEAFQALPSWIMTFAHSRPRLAKALVTELLSYHASPEFVTESNFTSQDGTSIETFHGVNLTLSFLNGTYFVNDAQVNQSITGSNGMLYQLNRYVFLSLTVLVS